MPISDMPLGKTWEGGISDRSALSDSIQGFALGVAEDPLVGGLVEEFVSWFPEFQGEDVKQKLRDNLAGAGTASKVAKTAGELTALLGPGIGAFSLTRAALRGVIAKYGTGPAAQYLNQGAGGLASATRPGAMSLLNNPAAQQAAFASRLGQAGGAGASFETAPMGLRVGEALAGSAGFGIEGGARAEAEGEDLHGILERAGINAALALGGEAALIGAGKIPGVKRFLGKPEGNIQAGLQAQDPKILGQRDVINQELDAISQKIVNRVLGRTKTGKTASGAKANPPAVNLQSFVGALAENNPIKAAAGDAKRFKAINEKMANLGPAEYQAALLKHFRQQEVELAAIGEKAGIKVQEAQAAEVTATLEATARQKAGKPVGARLTGKIHGLRQVRQEAETNLARANSNLEILRGNPKAGFDGVIPAIERGRALPEYMDDLATTRKRPRPTTQKGENLEHLQNLAYGDVAFSAAGVNQLITKLMDDIVRSPESVLRRYGTTGVVGWDLARLAGMESRQLNNQLTLSLVKKFRVLAQAMAGPENTSGFKPGWRQTARFAAFDNHEGGLFAAPVLDVYTDPKLRGLDSVRDVFGPKVEQAWSAVIKEMDKQYDALSNIGVVPKRLEKSALMAQQEVANFFPQWWNVAEEKRTELAIAKLRKIYRKAGHSADDAEMHAQNYMSRLEANARHGVNGLGNADFQSMVPGAMRDKIDAGMAMMEDPFRVLQHFYQASAHRQTFGKYFADEKGGWSMVDALIDGMVKEGVPHGRASHIINGVVGRSHGDATGMKVARVIGNTEIMSKLGLAVFPNFAQPVNDIAANGFRNYVSGMRLMMSKEGRKAVAEAMGLTDFTRQSLMQTMLDDLAGVSGTLGQVPTDKMTKFYLIGTGFTLAEAMNRTMGTAVALSTFRRTVEQLERGALRGHQFARAERRMASLGVDLKGLMRDGFHKGDSAAYRALENKIAFRGSQLTQFIPDQTRVPLAFQTPVGRVLFQFKSFAFNQAKFIRDNVLREALEGNMKPLGYMLTIYPMAGEMVNLALDNFRDNPKQRNGLWRYVDDIATVGGFGLLESTMRGLYWNDGAGVLLGPGISDMISLTEAFVQPNSAEAIEKDFKRSPFYRQARAMGKGGRIIATSLEDVLDMLRQDGGEDSKTYRPSSQSPMIGDLLSQQIQNRNK